jgi:hypothetical protein
MFKKTDLIIGRIKRKLFSKNFIWIMISFFMLIILFLLFFKIYYYHTLGLTELYFLNHEELPFSVEKNKNYNFSFAVHNLEDEDLNYTCSIIQKIDNRSPLILEDGICRLKKREYKYFTKSFNVTLDFEYAKITVKLEYLNKTQEIHFFVKSV